MKMLVLTERLFCVRLNHVRALIRKLQTALALLADVSNKSIQREQTQVNIAKYIIL